MPPLSCSPDAAFQLSFQGHSKVYYLERDLGTSSAQQIAARKSKGYAELCRQMRHREHFPTTTMDRFGVLVVTTNRNRCLSLARELQKCESHDLWRMVSATDLTSEQMMTEPIFYGTETDEPKRLLKINLPPAIEQVAATIPAAVP